MDASSEPDLYTFSFTGAFCVILAGMDIIKMLAELRQEREQVEEAIMTLERVARGRGKRRGRPPAWMTATKRRGRPPGSKNKPKSETA